MYMRNVYLDAFVNPFKTDHTCEWINRHVDAIHSPNPGFERAIVSLLSGWLRYPDAHKSHYHSGIGEDRILGGEWARMGGALRGLLNDETGRLDRFTLGRLICETLKAERFELDEYSPIPTHDIGFGWSVG